MADGFDEVIPCRGWSMRHGQKAKVEARRGGAGGASGCGRSVCARSTGKTKPRYFGWSEIERKTNSKSALAWRDAQAWLEDEASWSSNDVQVDFEDSAVWTVEFDSCLRGPGFAGDFQDSGVDMASDRSWSCESSDTESEEECGDGEKTVASASTTCRFEPLTTCILEAIPACGSREGARWQAAIAVAEGSARIWWSQHCAGELSASGELQARRRKRPNRQTLSPTWDEFQQRFLRKHLKRLAQDLESIWSEQVDFMPAPLNSSLCHKFLADMGRFEEKVVPVFHGTKPDNFDSIYNYGLLVPGEGNDIKIANGSLYGKGIYTAMVGNARTSNSFAHAQKRMLVCAVLDNEVKLRNDLSLDDAVKHLSSSVLVVRDSRRVVPVFEAVANGVHLAKPPQPPPLVVFNAVAGATLAPRSLRVVSSAVADHVRLSQATSWRTCAGGRKVAVNVKVVRTAQCCKHAGHHRSVVQLESFKHHTAEHVASFLTRRGAMKRRPRQVFM